MQQTHCTHCGTANDAAQKYCRACGFILPKPERAKITTNAVALRPNKERAQMAIILLWVCAAMQIPMIFMEGLMQKLMLMIINSSQIPLAAITATVFAQMAFALAYLIIDLLSLIVFLQWFHRAYYNLRQLKGTRLLYRTGWAVGGMFVPILQLYRPYRIMNELHRESKRILYERGVTERLPKNIAAILWCVVFIQLLPALILVLSQYIPTPYFLLSNTYIIKCLLEILAVLLTLKWVSDYAKIEDLLAGY